MTDHTDDAYAEFSKLYNKIEYSDIGPERYKESKRLIRLAESLDDADALYDAKSVFIYSAIAGGSAYFDEAMSVFSWCRARFMEAPDLYDSFEFLWNYKMMLEIAADYPKISLDQLELMVNDLQQLHRKFGVSPEVVAGCKVLISMTCGNFEEGRRLYRVWQKMESDEQSNCKACTQNNRMKFWLKWNDFNKAYELAQPILKGTLSCAEIPHATYPYLLTPMHLCGRVDEAHSLSDKACNLVAKRHLYHMEIGHVLTYLTLAKRWTKAVNLLRKSIVRDPRTLVPLNRLEHSIGAWIFLEGMLLAGKSTINIDLPDWFPDDSKTDLMPVIKLRDYYQTDARDLARDFDQRNGNSYYSEKLEETSGLVLNR